MASLSSYVSSMSQYSRILRNVDNKPHAGRKNCIPQNRRKLPTAAAPLKSPREVAEETPKIPKDSTLRRVEDSPPVFLQAPLVPSKLSTSSFRNSVILAPIPTLFAKKASRRLSKFILSNPNDLNKKKQNNILVLRNSVSKENSVTLSEIANRMRSLEINHNVFGSSTRDEKPDESGNPELLCFDQKECSIVQQGSRLSPPNIKNLIQIQKIAEKMVQNMKMKKSLEKIKSTTNLPTINLTVSHEKNSILNISLSDWSSENEPVVSPSPKPKEILHSQRKSAYEKRNNQIHSSCVSGTVTPSQIGDWKTMNSKIQAFLNQKAPERNLNQELRPFHQVLTLQEQIQRLRLTRPKFLKKCIKTKLYKQRILLNPNH